jgi:hypothetical protein
VCVYSWWHPDSRTSAWRIIVEHLVWYSWTTGFCELFVALMSSEPRLDIRGATHNFARDIYPHGKSRVMMWLLARFTTCYTGGWTSYKCLRPISTIRVREELLSAFHVDRITPVEIQRLGI